MTQQATLILIKPDAVQKGLTGPVLTRLEEAKLSLIGVKVVRVNRKLAEVHYQALRDKPFFQDLLRHLCGELHGGAPVLALVYAGPDAIAKMRQLAGATNPEEALPTTIRGAFGRNTASGIMENVLHASADPQEAKREIALWFRPEELLESVDAPTSGAVNPALKGGVKARG